MNAQAMMNKIKAGQLDDAFRRVYVTDGEVAKQKSRYMELLTTFAETFGGDREVHLMSAPGRTEICGNHTDHNHGKVLAAAINLMPLPLPPRTRTAWCGLNLPATK